MTEERFRGLIFSWGFLFFGIWGAFILGNAWGILLAWVGLLYICLVKEEGLMNDIQRQDGR